MLESDAELVLEMDCDFSHDPADVPRLIAACEDGADLALGSRWVEGGGTVNWGLLRRIISRGGSLYARLVLGVGVHDLTGGFKCFRRAVLETIDRDAIAARGYGFQIEGTYRALRQGVPRRRGADHVRRPPRRPVEDERLDRRRGDAAGAGAPLEGAAGPAVIERDRRDVRRRRARRRRPVLVDFTAPWCRPCRAIEPFLVDLEREHEGRSAARPAGHRRQPRHPARYGVLSLPTVIVFVAGEPVETIHGAQPAARYAEAVARALGGAP